MIFDIVCAYAAASIQFMACMVLGVMSKPGRGAGKLQLAGELERPVHLWHHWRGHQLTIDGISVRLQYVI